MKPLYNYQRAPFAAAAFFFIATVFSTENIIAGTTDSLPPVTVPTSVRYIYENDFRAGNAIYLRPDSDLSSADKVNPAIDLQYNYLGVPGSAAEPMLYHPPGNLYTGTLTHSYDLYLIANDSVRYFNSNKKFTEINYHSGTFKELAIDVLHSQNILRGWNAGIFFNRYSVRDFMINSDTYRSRLMLFSSYHSPSGHYSFFANAKWEQLKNQVNGGLAEDSVFLFSDIDNVSIKAIAPNLNDALQRISVREFYASQYFDAGGNKKDTAGKSYSVPSVRFHHEILYSRKSYTYLDDTPDSAFYNNFYYSQLTYDSLSSDEITNELAIILPADRRRSSSFFRSWSMSAGLQSEIVQYHQKENLSWNDLAFSGKIISRYDSSLLNAEASVRFVTSGRDAGNFEGIAKVFTKAFVFGSFGGQLKISRSSADIIYSLTETNNFIWKNSFSPVDNKELIISYSLPENKLSISTGRIITGNFVYLGANAFPLQHAGDITVDQVRLQKNFAWRSLRFENRLTFQRNNTETVLHLAPFFSQHALYVSRLLFKKRLPAEIGFNGAYNSPYFANDYMPATSLFFLQDKLKTGGYARLDLFVRFKIKSARIFLKMENVNDNIGKKSYFIAPHYAQPGKVFRFGLVWRFFDQ